MRIGIQDNANYIGILPNLLFFSILKVVKNWLSLIIFLTGGHAKNFFNSPEKVKEVLEELVPDEHKHFIDDLIDLLKRLCKIVGVWLWILHIF